MSSPVHDIVSLLAALGLANSARNQLLPAPFNVSAKTANYTISPAQSIDPIGTLFTNRGAGGSVTFTLPAPTAVPTGAFYLFLVHAGQNVLIAPPTVDTLVTKNDAAADSVAISTAGELIGGLAIAICDGTQWFCVGLSVGHTFTVAT